MIRKYVHAASVKAFSTNGRKNGLQGQVKRRSIVPKKANADMVDHIQDVELLKSDKACGISPIISCMEPQTFALIRMFRIKSRIVCGVVRGIAAQCCKFLNVVFDFDFVPGTFEARRQSMCHFNHNTRYLNPL